jgi:hypothetical protein
MRLRLIRWWFLLLILSVLAIVGCDHDGTFGTVEPGSTGPSVVRLVPTRITYHVGETVVTYVFIENAHNVGSVPFHLLYDKDVIEFLPPAIEGPFMSEDGTNTVFLAIDAGGGGELVVGLARLSGGTGAHGSGVLATFEFTAINPGSSGLTFTLASVRDPQAQVLPATFSVVRPHVEP